MRDPGQHDGPTDDGPKNVLGDQPVYASGDKQWIPVDFSLQMSQALTQWGQWQVHAQADLVTASPNGKAAPKRTPRMFRVTLPAR